MSIAESAQPERRDYGTEPLEAKPLPAEVEAPLHEGASAGHLDATQPLVGKPLPADLDATRPLAARISIPTIVPNTSNIVTTARPKRTAGGLQVAVLRDVGQKRQVNQDSIYGLVSSVPRGESDVQLGLFIVADGMGGHDAGEVASRIAIVHATRAVMSDLLVPALDEAFSMGIQDVVVGAVQEANRAIWDYAKANGLDLGTTCTVALILGRTVYLGHVGDSRAYLVEHDSIRQLTEDHSAVGRLIQMGQLEPGEAREHPLRSQLYRTVGQSAEIYVDFSQEPLGSAEYLFLCSDGLWGMLDDRVICDTILQAATPQDACRSLIELANAAGGEDNISAVVVQL